MPRKSNSPAAPAPTAIQTSAETAPPAPPVVVNDKYMAQTLAMYRAANIAYAVKVAEVGTRLGMIQLALGHGKFTKWVENGGIPYRTARDYIRFAEWSAMEGRLLANPQNVNPSTLYALPSGTTPEMLKELADKAESRPLTRSDVTEVAKRAPKKPNYMQEARDAAAPPPAPEIPPTPVAIPLIDTRAAAQWCGNAGLDWAEEFRLLFPDPAAAAAILVSPEYRQWLSFAMIHTPDSGFESDLANYALCAYVYRRNAVEGGYPPGAEKDAIAGPVSDDDDAAAIAAEELAIELESAAQELFQKSYEELSPEAQEEVRDWWNDNRDDETPDGDDGDYLGSEPDDAHDYAETYERRHETIGDVLYDPDPAEGN